MSAATSNITLATGPVTWGVDFADAPGNPPWEQVLDDIGRSGLGALELGPIGYLPEDPATLRTELTARRLTAIGSFVFEDLHDTAQQPSIIAATERACRAIAAAGGQILVVIDRPAPERAATAGRGDIAPRLGERQWKAMLGTISRIADVADRHGLCPAVHPHAGSYIEFQDEIERLLSDSELPLCLDTGHAAYAGLLPERAFADYGPRVAHVHLKDVSAAVLARVRTENLGFWQAIAAGVFCPLGTGLVDLRAIAAALHHAAYDGSATIEQDRTPGSGAPLDDLCRSVDALHSVGIGSETVRLRPGGSK